MPQYFRNSIFVLLSFVLFSCGNYEEVEFRQVKDLRVKGVENGVLVLDGLAEFYNPNSSGVKLRGAEVEVFVKDKKIAHLSAVEKIRIKPNGTFEIPLDAKVELKGSGFVGNMLSILTKKELELKFRGYIEVSRWWIPRKFDIEDSQKLKF